MIIENNEHLRWYVDTLKVLYRQAHYEHNTEVCRFLRRYTDGLVAQSAMLPLVADDSTRHAVATASEIGLQAVATALANPIAALPPDHDGGVKAKLPEPPPKPNTPPPAAHVEIDF